MRNLFFCLLIGILFWGCSDENPSSSFAAISSSSTIEAYSSSIEDVESSSSAAISSSSEMIISSSSGLSYGELVDERDGQVYKTVKIGKQIWMAENLNYAYTEPIKVGYTTIDSASFCNNNEPDSCAKYGRLYVWEAAVGCTNENIKSRMTDEGFNSRGICPDNWHIPSIDEWEILIEYTNGLTMDLKSTSGWEHEANGSDTWGFSVLPAGLYDITNSKEIHLKYNWWFNEDEVWNPAESAGKYTCFGTHMPWTQSLSSHHYCNHFQGYYAVCFSSKELDVIRREEMENFFAFSVRCVKDSTKAE